MEAMKNVAVAVALTGALTAGAISMVRSAANAKTLDRIEERLAVAEGPAVPARDWTEPIESLQLDLAELAARVESVVRRPRTELVAREPEGGDEPSSAAEVPAEDASDAAAVAERTAELSRLLDGLFGPDHQLQGSPEEQARFFELAREAGLLDARLAELEARIAADPNDLDARLELADLYIAKLFTVPGGPEQGLWGGKAESQWQAVVALDPERWDANVSLGTSYAYYPDVMNKTGDAIEHLEQALAIQRTLVPVDEHAVTYVYLSSLYRRQGRLADAAAILTEGLAVHPGNSQLEEALAGLSK